MSVVYQQENSHNRLMLNHVKHIKLGSGRRVRWNYRIQHETNLEFFGKAKITVRLASSYPSNEVFDVNGSENQNKNYL